MFGIGPRNPTTRYLRLGALLVVLLAGSVFHHSGGAYSAIRYVYLALVVGLLVVGVSRRRGFGSGGGRNLPPPSYPMNSPPQNPVAGSLASPGWFPDPHERNVERYWDGVAWTRQRQFDGTEWVEK